MAEYKASSVDEAIRIGLEEMGLTREQAVVEVLEQGGFLKKAKVSIEKKPSAADVVVKFVKDIAQFLEAECTFEATETEDRVTVLISGDEAGKLIGYRGDVLDAIQYIASVVLNKEHKEYKRVTIDCENYREKREESLKKLAERLAEKAVRTARKVRLEPMNPAERRVIHAALQGNSDVETVSVGNEPNRYLTIVPKNMKKDRRDRDRRGPRDRRPREGAPEGETAERREGDARPEFRSNGRRDGRRDDRRGDRRDDRRGGGSRGPAPKKSFLGFGSYLGNTRTSLEREILEEKKQAFREHQYVEPADEPEETPVVPENPGAEE